MNSTADLFPALAERLGWALVHSLWQGALIAAAATVLLRALRSRSAAARHAVCMAGMFALLGAMAVTALRAPGGRKVVAPAVASARVDAGALPGIDRVESATTDDLRAPVAPAPRGQAAAPSAARISWQELLTPWVPWLSAAWLGGVLLLTARHCGGWWRVRRWRRSGVMVETEVERRFTALVERFGVRPAVRLLESAEACVPMLTGVLKPVVLLPARVLTGVGAAEVDGVLGHELAHLARRDTWANLAQVVVETVLFYHPAVWWLGRRAREEREHAADDLALRVCTDRRCYAGALARLAEIEAEPAWALAATGGKLLARIRRIVAPPAPEPAPGVASPALLAVAALAVIAIAHAAGPKTIEVAAGESLQAAIDAAPPGAVLRLGAGEWKERIVIAKPLTIEGAGWEKTIVKPDQPAADVTPELKGELLERLRQLKTADDRLAWDREWHQKCVRPTLLVRGTGQVVVRGLRIGGVNAPSRVSAGNDTLVVFDRAQAELSRCAVVGPFGNGLLLLGGSDVKVAHSLVAAMWSEGIVIGSGRLDGTNQPSRLHLADSEVRNVYHYGIVLGPGCDTTVIERSRISGTAWHGIRYDDASPTIRDNVIFKNARSGIYASGTTAAKVTGNLFWRNEMSGMSCWFKNTDTIEGNTFAGNLREGLSVLGASRTVVRRNLFAGNPVAIVCGSISGDTSTLGEPVLEANLFHDNKDALLVKGEKQPAPAGSLASDPKFRDAAKADFALLADSPARAAKAGVAEPLASAGPWPLLAEEKAIIPADDTREFRYWGGSDGPAPSKAATDAAVKAANNSKAWIDDAFQLDDRAKRAAAIERIRAAMTSADAETVRTGIVAFGRLGPIEFDKASFRPAVRALLGSADVATRAAAASAFTLTGAEPGDLPRIFALADDPAAEVRTRLTGIIMSVTQRDLTSAGASEAILKLMSNLSRDSRDVAHSLWSGKFSPEIEAKVIELCRDLGYASNSSDAYNFFYGALSTQANKSEASCRRLIELLAHEDTTNIAGRSAWGLQQGVAKEQYPLVAAAMLRVLEARSDGHLHRSALGNLARYGDASHVAGVKALLAKPGVDGEFRKELEKAVETLSVR